jgi:hypothetical protein
MTSLACLATSANIALTGPGRNDWDLALFRDIPLPWFKGESSSVQLRIETNNTFNHPQRTAVNLFCSSTIALALLTMGTRMSETVKSAPQPACEFCS